MPTEMPSEPTTAEGQTTATDCAVLLQRITPLALEYESNLKKRDVDIGFNLFELISDHYYRETFHSDILNSILDPSAKHQGGNIYLELFLKFIRSLNAKINLPDYSKAEVVKEEDRIDILIKGQVDAKGLKHAIIIENKINNACDQPEQLPTYLNKVLRNGYICDAIIYLRLNGDTPPDMATYKTDDDRNKVNDRLKVICAYDDSGNNLLKGWIEPCEKASKQLNNLDAPHILRQYGKIIEKLGGNTMNKPIMEKFYNIIREGKGENLKTALSLKAMVDDLILFRVERIIDKFKDVGLTPFKHIGNCGNYDAYFDGLLWKDANLGLDIGVEPKSYSFVFWDKNDPEGAKGRAKTILEKMECLPEYNFNGKFTRKTGFEFPSQEDDLIQHITVFKKNLDEAIKSESNQDP
jgi:hypothetical protein